MNKKLIIIGAGVSGLATGIYAINSGFDVTILEKNSYVGGKLSIEKNYPIAIPYTNDLNNIFNDLDLNLEFIDNDILLTYYYNDQKIYIDNDLNKLLNELLMYSQSDETNILELINLIEKGKNYYINTIKPESFYTIFDYGKAKKNFQTNDKIIKKYSKISIKEYFNKFNSDVIKNIFINILPKDISMSTLIFYLGYLTSGNIKYVKSDIVSQLYEKFISLGGKLLLNKEVVDLTFDHYNMIKSVKTKDEIIEGDYFTSSIDAINCYNKLLKNKYKDKKLMIKANNYLDYYLERKIIFCFESSEKFESSDLILNVNEFGFNTQRFNHLYFKTNGNNLYCIFNQNKNDYDYLKIIYNKNYKNAFNEIISLIINNLKLYFPKNKVSFIKVVTPIDIEKEVNCYEGYLNGFKSMPNGLNYSCDLNINGINNLYLSSSILLLDGGIVSGLIAGKFVILQMLRSIKNEKKKR